MHGKRPEFIVVRYIAVIVVKVDVADGIALFLRQAVEVEDTLVDGLGSASYISLSTVLIHFASPPVQKAGESYLE